MIEVSRNSCSCYLRTFRKQIAVDVCSYSPLSLSDEVLLHVCDEIYEMKYGELAWLKKLQEITGVSEQVYVSADLLVELVAEKVLLIARLDEEKAQGILGRGALVLKLKSLLDERSYRKFVGVLLDNIDSDALKKFVLGLVGWYESTNS